MKTIWKFPLDLTGNDFNMPHGAEILCIKKQNDVPTLWVSVDPREYTVSRQILCYGTGFTLPLNPGRYIDTLLLAEDTLVLHYYDAGETVMAQQK